MKIIVSAIACTPGAGSEGGIGWNAVLTIARHHDVRVITQTMNRPDWDEAEKMGLVPPNVRVRYLSCGEKWHPNRMIARIQSWTGYLKFSRLVLNEALKWHEEEPADLVHQVTYATWRVSSPLWRMPIPFVWGPVGGSAVFPSSFLGILGTSSRLFERVRETASWISVRNPNFLRCVRNTTVILAANEETYRFLAAFRKGKPLLKVPSAHLTREQIARFQRQTTVSRSPGDPLRLFAGGNIEGRKGVSLALRAIALLKQRGIQVHYTVAGGGPEIPTLVRLSETLGIQAQVTFHPGYSGEGYVRILQETDVYLLPSFRETTPVTLMEAIAAGCLPVVADASAAGEMVKASGGVAVPAHHPDQLVNDLADELTRICRDRHLLIDFSRDAIPRLLHEYSSEVYDRGIEEAYGAALHSARSGEPLNSRPNPAKSTA